MRKAIQITSRYGDGIYALCDDGTIWTQASAGWCRVEAIPGSDEPEESDAAEPADDEPPPRGWSPDQPGMFMWAVSLHNRMTRLVESKVDFYRFSLINDNRREKFFFIEAENENEAIEGVRRWMESKEHRPRASMTDGKRNYGYIPATVQF